MIGQTQDHENRPEEERELSGLGVQPLPTHSFIIVLITAGGGAEALTQPRPPSPLSSFPRFPISQTSHLLLSPCPPIPLSPSLQSPSSSRLLSSLCPIFIFPTKGLLCLSTLSSPPPPLYPLPHFAPPPLPRLSSTPPLPPSSPPPPPLSPSYPALLHAESPTRPSPRRRAGRAKARARARGNGAAAVLRIRMPYTADGSLVPQPPWGWGKGPHMEGQGVCMGGGEAETGLTCAAAFRAPLRRRPPTPVTMMATVA